MDKSTAPPDGKPPALLSLRATLLLIVSSACGGGAGVLTALADQPWPTAVLAGFAAAGSTVKLLDKLVER